MEKLVANLSGRTRTEHIGSREFLVAPVTMIVPGVLNGSKGPLLYSAEEIAKNFSAWNNMPLILNHPIDGGSGRTPTILQEQGIGHVLKASIANSKLIAEAWFDVENTLRLDPGTFASLRANKPIELSTGLGLELEPAPTDAVDNGNSYSFVVRNIQPDHLAILPDQVGACSVRDGCGVFNAKNGMTTEDDTFHIHKVFLNDQGNGGTETVNQHSHFVIKFIVQESGGHDHKLNRNSLTNNKGEPEMGRLTDVEKKTAVDSLIANVCCWEEEDREALNGFSDEKLQKLVKNAEKEKQYEIIANSALKGIEDVDGNKHVYNEKTKAWDTIKKPKPPEKKNEDEPVENVKTNVQTEEEWLASAPPDIQEDLAFARDEKARQKEKLIEKLIVNVKNEQEQARFAERLLKAKVSDLQDMLLLLPEEKPVLDYSGASGGPIATNAEESFAPFGLPDEYIPEDKK